MTETGARATQPSSLIEQMQYQEKPDQVRRFIEILTEYGLAEPLTDILNRGKATLYTVFHDGRSGGSILDNLYASRRAVMNQEEREKESAERTILMDTTGLWYFMKGLEDYPDGALEKLNNQIMGHNQHSRGEDPERILQMKIRVAQQSGFQVDEINAV